MRALLASTDLDCRRAVEHYCYWAARHAASLVSALGGLDAVVFTAGIGSNSPEVRSRIVSHLTWLGLMLDEEANSHNADRLSTTESLISAWCVPADEELVIARHAIRTLGIA